MNKTAIGIGGAVVVVLGLWLAFSSGSAPQAGAPAVTPEVPRVQESKPLPTLLPNQNVPPTSVGEQAPPTTVTPPPVPVNQPARQPVTQPPAPAPALPAAVREFVVTGQNFSFTPSTLTVKKGTVVRLTFKNAGGFHDFVIDELGVRTQQIGNGAEETVTFTPDKAGSFEYYCSVGSHRAMGMRGTLTVTE